MQLLQSLNPFAAALLKLAIGKRNIFFLHFIPTLYGRICLKVARVTILGGASRLEETGSRLYEIF